MSLLFGSQTLFRLSQSKTWLGDESMRFTETWMERAEIKQGHKVVSVDQKKKGTKRDQGWRFL